MRSPILLLAAFVFAVACAPSPEPDGPDGTGGGRTFTVDLPQSRELAGQEVEEFSDGAWTVRRAGASSASRTRGRRALELTDAAVATGEAPAEEGEAMPGMDGGGDYGGPGAPASDPAAPAAAKAMPDAAPTSPPPTGGMAGRPLSRSPAKSEDAGSAPVRQAPALRAGKTDDNENYDEFLEFLASWSDKPELAGRFDMLDVSDRRWIRVVNDAGAPIPAAEVRVVDVTNDRVLLRATTYGDGRVPFYPNLLPPVPPTDAGGMATIAAGSPDLVVEAAFGGTRTRKSWDGQGGELELALPVAKPIAEPVALDVLFLIDTTGSMGDEIRRIKASLLSVTEKLRSLSREFDLRYGAVLYRDLGDEYVTKAHPFTGDIRAFDQALAGVEADGGGDGPESLNQGLAEAVGRADWRSGAAKVMFLIADAPPHLDYAGDVRYGESVKAALAKGIRIHSVAASGLDEMGSLVFRQIAQFTRGKFIFIQYGSIADSGAAHGVKGAKKSNNLDDILFEQIREEVARWGR